MVDVRIHRLDKEIEMPKYAKKGDAAFDIRNKDVELVKLDMEGARGL